jgi:hypothetical protein
MLNLKTSIIILDIKGTVKCSLSLEHEAQRVICYEDGLIVFFENGARIYSVTSKSPGVEKYQLSSEALFGDLGNQTILSAQVDPEEETLLVYTNKRQLLEFSIYEFLHRSAADTRPLSWKPWSTSFHDGPITVLDSLVLAFLYSFRE